MIITIILTPEMYFVDNVKRTTISKVLFVLAKKISVLNGYSYCSYSNLGMIILVGRTDILTNSSLQILTWSGQADKCLSTSL